MNTLINDTQLEAELQELYILSNHWLQDIYFMEDEIHFFKNILAKYKTGDLKDVLPSRYDEFKQKIEEQEQQLAALKKQIPLFLDFLKPFIKDIKKEITLDFLEKYNHLQDEIKEMFSGVRENKNHLFKYTESMLPGARQLK
ncbi:MAG TPA: hypothetical protein VHA56_01040 [Mucilaginibacter sp.]|nr:hypothetical protein [Mucilaginibacter sp.]